MTPGILEMVKDNKRNRIRQEFYFSLSSGTPEMGYTEESLWKSIYLHRQWSLMQPAPDMSFAVSVEHIEAMTFEYQKQEIW